MNSNKGLAGLIIGNAKLVLLIFVLLGIAAGFFATKFKIDASADTLLLKDNKLFIETQVMNQRFSPEEFILLAYEPKKHDVFSQQTFDDITSLSTSLESFDRVKTVNHILNVPLLSQASELNANLNPDEFTWQSKQYSPEVMADIFKSHPIFTDLLVNKSQSATAIQIVFEQNPKLLDLENQIINIQKTLLDKQELTDEQQQQIDQLKQQADPIQAELKKQRQQEIEQIYELTAPYKESAAIYLGGAYVLGQQMIEIVQSDLVVFGSAIGLAIVILLFILFRRIRWVMLPVICCSLSVLLTVGLFGLLDMRATVISSNFIALQLILTLAVVIHLIVEFRQLSAKQQDQGQNHNALLIETFNRKFKPCLYAAITTSVGFASLVFSGIQPVVSFGWMMIVAMFVSILVSLILFPAFLSLVNERKENTSSKVTEFVIGVFKSWVLTFPKTIVIGSVIITGVAVVGILRLDVENSFLNYFKSSTQVHKELTFIDQQFGGSTPLDVVYTIPAAQQDPELELTAETVQTLQKIQAVLQSYEEMGNSTSIVNFTELAMTINSGKPLTEYELTAIYRLLDDSLKDKLLGAYFIPEQNQLRISSRIKDSTENFDRAEFMRSLKADLEAIGVKQSDYSLTNLFVLYQDILQRLFSSQIVTLGLVFIALTLVLFAIFKSIKIALIAVIPNILTTLVILGVMGWFNIALDLMTITIAAIAMGIAVDDTIHFVHRFLEERQQNSANEAVSKTFDSVGYALLYTTTIIALGFALLSFSDFVPSILFGLLTALAMLVALITDSTLLPVLLKRFVHLDEPKLNNDVKLASE